MATDQDLAAALTALSQGITDLGVSLSAEIKKLDDEIAAAKAAGTGVDPAKLDPILAGIQAQTAALTTLKTQADDAV